MLVAWSGAITAEINGYADLGMGFGMALTGIGTVVIGRQILKPFYRSHHFILPLEFSRLRHRCFLYFLVINLFLAWGVNPINLKLLLGLFLVFFLRFTATKSKYPDQARTLNMIPCRQQRPVYVALENVSLRFPSAQMTYFTRI